MRKKLLIIVLATLAYRSTSNMLQTSVPLYAEYFLHSGDFIVSLIVTISSLSSLISLLYFGFRSVSVGKGILISLIMSTISVPLFLVTYNQVSLTIVYAFVSFWTGSLGMLLLTAVALIGEAHDRQNNIAIFTAMLSLSLFLGPIYQSGILAATRNSLVDSMVLFAPLVCLATLFASTLRFDSDLKAGGRFELGFITNRSFWTGVVINESFTFPFIFIVTFGGIFAKNHFNIGYSEIQALFGVFFFTSFATRFFLVRQERFGKHLMTLSSFVAIFIGLIAAYLSANMIEFVAGIILLGYSHGVTYPVASTRILTSVPKEKLVEANSVFSLIDTADYLIAAPIIGLLAESTGIRLTIILIEVPVIAFFLGFLALSRKMVEGQSSTTIHVSKS